MVEVVCHLFRSDFVPLGLNSNFLILIPKVPDVISLDKYRPTVIGNLLFNLFFKILVDRLVVIVSRIFNHQQFMFI